jgi:NAD(P)-dependent dehydrogenase (short-subunit alcohol dehydrogenase family)
MKLTCHYGSLTAQQRFLVAEKFVDAALDALGSEFFRDRPTSTRRERLVAETRTGRAGTTADVAAMVMFLASPAAGQVIHVNGGAYLGR